MRRKYTLEEKLEALFVISLSVGIVAAAVLWVAMLVAAVLSLSGLGRFL